MQKIWLPTVIKNSRLQFSCQGAILIKVSGCWLFSHSSFFSYCIEVIYCEDRRLYNGKTPFYMIHSLVQFLLKTKVPSQGESGHISKYTKACMLSTCIMKNLYIHYENVNTSLAYLMSKDIVRRIRYPAQPIITTYVRKTFQSNCSRGSSLRYTITRWDKLGNVLLLMQKWLSLRQWCLEWFPCFTMEASE